MKKIALIEDYQKRIKSVLVTEEEIKSAVAKAGGWIDRIYDGKPILLVSILKEGERDVLGASALAWDVKEYSLFK